MTYLYGFSRFIAFTQRPLQRIIKYFGFNRNVVENTWPYFCNYATRCAINFIWYYKIYGAAVFPFAVATMLWPSPPHRSSLPNTIYAVNHNLCTWFCFSLSSSSLSLFTRRADYVNGLDAMVNWSRWPSRCLYFCFPHKLIILAQKLWS